MTDKILSFLVGFVFAHMVIMEIRLWRLERKTKEERER